MRGLALAVLWALALAAGATDAAPAAPLLDLSSASGAPPLRRRRAQDEADVTQVDLYIVADSSGSITAANPQCFHSTGETCWQQATAYVFNITTALEAQSGGWAVVTDGVVGDAGLGMACYTFACGNDSPATVNVTADGLVYNEQALKGVVYYMRELIEPAGTTCPSDALSFSLALIEAQPAYRPNQMVVVLTDGLIDAADEAATRAVAQDLETQGASIFVVAIGASGWDNETVASVFGDTAKLVPVASFADLAGSVNELAEGILNEVDREGEGEGEGESTPAPTTPGVKHAGPTTRDSFPEPDSGSGSGAAAGAVLGVCLASVVVGGALFVKRKKRAAQTPWQLK